MKSIANWYLIPLGIVLLVLFPTGVVLSSFFHVDLAQTNEIWSFLSETILAELILNTLVLLLGVSTLSFFIGTGLAWVVVMYDFPLKRFIEGGLILPMAMPGYVIGIVALEHWDYAGSVPIFLRSMLGENIWIPDIRSTWCVIVALSLVLYPYMYIAARTAFKYQNQTFLDVGTALGLNKFQLYWKIGLPLARPTLFAGLALVVMETLADMGTVSVFSFTTFTTAIYETWQGLFQKEAATQMAGSLMLFTFALFYLGTLTQRKLKHHQVSGKRRPLRISKITGWRGGMVSILLFSMVSLAFIYPTITIIYWQIQRGLDLVELMDVVRFGYNSGTIAIFSTILVLLASIYVSYARRITDSRVMQIITQISVTGFVLPGTIIALGVLIPFVWIDGKINAIWDFYFNTKVGLFLTSSIVGLVLAHFMRFFAVGFFFTDSGFSKLSHTLDHAAMSLGKTRLIIFLRVHLPLIKNSLIVGALIVFIDVIKEVAATLILRPFGFNTLSTKIWELSTESFFREASLCSMMIVFLMLIPVTGLIIVTGRD